MNFLQGVRGICHATWLFAEEILTDDRLCVERLPKSMEQTSLSVKAKMLLPIASESRLTRSEELVNGTQRAGVIAN
jgi:hypothetical protein